MTRDIHDRVADGHIAMRPHHHRHILRTSAGVSGLRIAQYRALDMLVKSGPPSISEPGRLLFVSKPSMTILADSLVENGWAGRENCSKDRRIVRFAIFPAGKKHLQQAFEVYRSDDRTHINGPGTEDPERMSAALNELERIFAKQEGGR